MMTKIALLLVALVILAGALAKWRKGDAAPGKAIEPARKCPDCGDYMIGPGACPCTDPAKD